MTGRPSQGEKTGANTPFWEVRKDLGQTRTLKGFDEGGTVLRVWVGRRKLALGGRKEMGEKGEPKHLIREEMTN